RAGVPMLPVVSGTGPTIRQMLIYTVALLPFPFLLLNSLGGIFFTVVLVMTIGWIILVASGLRTTELRGWAQANLRFSFIDLALISLTMIILTSAILYCYDPRASPVEVLFQCNKKLPSRDRDRSMKDILTDGTFHFEGDQTVHFNRIFHWQFF